MVRSRFLLLFFAVLLCQSFAWGSESSDPFSNAHLSQSLSDSLSLDLPANLDLPASSSQPFDLSQQETLKRFPQNFGKDFVSIFSRSNLFPALGAVVLTEASHSLWDVEVHEYFQDKNRIRGLRNAGNFIGGPILTTGLTAGLFAISQLTADQKFRSMGYSLAEAFLLNASFTEAIKFTARRTRPDLSNRRSFVSGHVSSIVVMSTVFTEYYGWKVGIPSAITSAIVATARVGSNRHFVSDVVAGAALGYIVGRTVSHQNLNKPSKVLWMPTVSPSGKSGGFVLLARW